MGSEYGVAKNMPDKYYMGSFREFFWLTFVFLMITIPWGIGVYHIIKHVKITIE